MIDSDSGDEDSFADVEICMPRNLKRRGIVEPIAIVEEYVLGETELEIQFDRTEPAENVIPVPSGTWDSDDEEEDLDWANGEGTMWELNDDAPDPEDDYESFHLLNLGERLGEINKKTLINCDIMEPLFEGSPYSARDFCRYLTAVKQNIGELFLYFLHLFTHI